MPKIYGVNFLNEHFKMRQVNRGFSHRYKKNTGLVRYPRCKPWESEYCILARGLIRGEVSKQVELAGYTEKTITDYSISDEDPTS